MRISVAGESQLEIGHGLFLPSLAPCGGVRMGANLGRPWNARDGILRKDDISALPNSPI
jgi:hypothetical protein